MKTPTKTKKPKGPTGYDLDCVGTLNSEPIHYLAKTGDKVVLRFTHLDGLMIFQQDAKHNIKKEICIPPDDVKALAVWLIRNCY